MRFWCSIATLALLAACTTTGMNSAAAPEEKDAGIFPSDGGEPPDAGIFPSDGGEPPDAGFPGAGMQVEQQVSSCGGFRNGAPQAPQPPGDAPDAGDPYCDRELLRWTYDPAAQALVLRHQRTLLNCCGERAIDIAPTGAASYRVLETDSPDPHGRCNCMCVFDFLLDSRPIASGTIALDVQRLVSENGTPRPVWQGLLDLAQGSGEIVLNDVPETSGCHR